MMWAKTDVEAIARMYLAAIAARVGVRALGFVVPCEPDPTDFDVGSESDLDAWALVHAEVHLCGGGVAERRGDEVAEPVGKPTVLVDINLADDGDDGDVGLGTHQRCLKTRIKPKSRDANQAYHRIASTNPHPISMRTCEVGRADHTAHGVVVHGWGGQARELLQTQY